MTTPEIDEKIGVFLRDLMLKVRHHGVFENVHLAFISYCNTSKYYPSTVCLLFRI